MPNIDQITPIKYQGLWPYHSHYDNLPLEYIATRIDLVNLATDQNEEILRDAIGSAGTLSNRLNQSIEDDGSLKQTAVDETEHSVGAHTDGEYEGVEYVRMLKEERDKLALIADEATAITVEIESEAVQFDEGVLIFQDSDTITWEVIPSNIIRANMSFPDTAAHEHYYSLVPVHANLMSPDYTNYKTTSVSTAYIEDSLRVYINGIRINEDDDVYVYDAATGPSGTWTLTSFTGNYSAGTFVLNRALSSSDIINIDFDISFV